MRMEKRGWFQASAILFLLLAVALTVYVLFFGPMKKCNYKGNICTNQPQPCRC